MVESTNSGRSDGTRGRWSGLPGRRFGSDEIRFVQLSHDKIAAVLGGEFWNDFIRLPIKFIGKPWNGIEEHRCPVRSRLRRQVPPRVIHHFRRYTRYTSRGNASRFPHKKKWLELISDDIPTPKNLDRGKAGFLRVCRSQFWPLGWYYLLPKRVREEIHNNIEHISMIIKFKITISSWCLLCWKRIE